MALYLELLYWWGLCEASCSFHGSMVLTSLINVSSFQSQVEMEMATGGRSTSNDEFHLQPSVDDKREDQSHYEWLGNPTMRDCRDLVIFAPKSLLEFECSNMNKISVSLFLLYLVFVWLKSIICYCLHHIYWKYYVYVWVYGA